MNEDADIEDLPSTVPADMLIKLMGEPENEEELATKIGEAVASITRLCGRYMDLSLLEGITVGWNYDEALQAVDLGYESSTAKTYTDTENLIGIAKTIRVRRGGAIKAHIVFNANQLLCLKDHKDPDYFSSVNLVAHELGHACLIAWFEKHSPGGSLETFRGDRLRGLLLDSAHTCWEEYAACRLASVFRHPAVKNEYLKRAIKHSTGVFAKAHEIIKAYRIHDDSKRTFLEVCGVIFEPIRLLSYYLGYMDGPNAGSGTLTEIEAFGDLTPFVESLRLEMQNAWNTEPEWDGLNGLNGLLNVILDILSSAGMEVTLDNTEDEQFSRVNFPFSPQTLPGGEVTYRLMKKQNLL